MRCFIQARMALQRGRSLDVVRAVQEATALLPKDADLLAEGAGLLLGAGRREQAEAMAREALAAQPRQKTALRVLADLAANRAIATGDTAARDEAIELYDGLAAEPGVDESFRNMAARLKLQAGDAAGAASMARRPAAQRPGDPISVGLLAEALAAEGKNGESAEAIGAWIGLERWPGWRKNRQPQLLELRLRLRFNPGAYERLMRRPANRPMPPSTANDSVAGSGTGTRSTQTMVLLTPPS